jgi:hypothetical protein
MRRFAAEMLVLLTGCAAPTSSVRDPSEACEELVLRCQKAVIKFEKALAANSVCSVDGDCVGGVVAAVPGHCCYAGNRNWWLGVEMTALTADSTKACGRRQLACSSYSCSAVCRDGRCRPVDDIEPSHVKN